MCVFVSVMQYNLGNKGTSNHETNKYKTCLPSCVFTSRGDTRHGLNKYLLCFSSVELVELVIECLICLELWRNECLIRLE